MKRRILALLLATACLLSLVVISPVAEATPSAEVKGHNLLLEEAVHMVYYVKFDNAPAGAEKGLLVWTNPQSNYAYGKEEAKLFAVGTDLGYSLFVFRGVAAKMMSQDIYAVPYVKVGSQITYGELDVYSVVQYAINKKGSTTMVAGGKVKLGELVEKLIDYGTTAQLYFGYNLDRLANDLFGKGNMPADTPTDTPPADEPSGEIVIRDFGGADYTILCNSYTDYEFNGSLVGDSIQYAVAERNFKVQNDFGINLNIVSQKGGWGERKDFTAAVRGEKLSGGVDNYDLIATHSVYLGWMGIEGLGKDLTQYADYLHLNAPYWSRNIYEELNLKGHLYMTVGDIAYTLYEYINVMFVNETQFENYFADEGGVRMLYDLVDAGEWTWEKLWEYAGAFGTGAIGDGKYGIATNTHAWRATFVSQDAHLYFRDSDGKLYLKNALDLKENNIIEDMVEHYSKDNLDFVVDFNGTHASQYNPEFLAGNILFYPQTLNEAKNLFSKAAENYGVVPLPKYDVQQEMYKTQCRDSVTAVMMMFTTENPIRTAIVTEAMAYYGREYIVPAYYENSLVNPDVIGRDTDKYVNILDTIRAGLTYQPGDCYIQKASGDSGSMRWDMFHQIVDTHGASQAATRYAGSVATGRNELKTFYAKLEKLGIVY